MSRIESARWQQSTFCVGLCAKGYYHYSSECVHTNVFKYNVDTKYMLMYAAKWHRVSVFYNITRGGTLKPSITGWVTCSKCHSPDLGIWSHVSSSATPWDILKCECEASSSQETEKGGKVRFVKAETLESLNPHSFQSNSRDSKKGYE